MDTHYRLPARLLPISLGLCLGLSGATPGRAVGPAFDLEGRLVLRSGDPAPVTARVGSQFDSIAVAPDALVFIDAAGSALFLKAGDEVRTLAYVGQASVGGKTIASLKSISAGTDGTIAFMALLPDRREAIFRIGPERGTPEEVVVAQDILELREGPATAGFLYPPVVDSGGAVVVSVGFYEVPGALVRFPRGAAPEIVMQTGDPLGPGAFTAPLAGPAVSVAGRIAFSATLDTGDSVVATLVQGEAPVVLAFYPLPTGPSSPVLTSIPPAINDAGEVTFLVVESRAVRVRWVSQGIPPITLAGPGTPAPGGGTFREISEFPPAIDRAGDVLFGAVRSNGRQGYYLVGSRSVALAEEGQQAGSAGTLVRVETEPLSDAAAALGADGTLHYAATATAASGIFSGGAGTVGVEVDSDDPIEQPRFVSFLDSRVPSEGGGPALAPGGLMIFDARVTGGSRGLFARDRSGTIRSLAHDGDPAPGGGRFDGNRFAFHSINDSRIYAFLGLASGTGEPAAISLFYGSIDDETIRRVADTETLPPGSSQSGTPGSGDRVKAAPSRVNGSGQIAVPVVQPDNTSDLMGYDGKTLFRIAGPGDPSPGGGTFTTMFTGSLFTGQPVPPALDEGGRLLFGAQTSFGDVALYAARLAPGGGGVPARIMGAGDQVEGGRLTPFELQALDADAAGRIAFQSIYSDEFDFASFVTEGGPAARLAARFDAVLDRGFVLTVLPLLALLGEGEVGYGVQLFDGSEVILAADPGSGEDPQILAAGGEPSPDGGAYVSFRSGQRSPGRLASGGSGTVALAAATTGGPEVIVLFGKTNAPPIADAGADLTAECAGPDATVVVLDGSASSDPDGDVLFYHWTGPFGEATGPRPAVTLPLGASTITLVVDDGQTASAPDTVRVEVLDTEAPSLEAAVTPSLLWPPDGRFVDVVVALQAADRCDPAPAVVLVDVRSSEPGTGRPGEAIGGASTGTDDRLVSLRADRSGSGRGRTYTLTYRACDGSGNSSSSAATVSVPHDQRR